jgi:hypothetical protein
MHALDVLAQDLHHFGATDDSLTAQANALAHQLYADIQGAAQSYVPQFMAFLGMLEDAGARLERMRQTLKAHPELGLRGEWMRLERSRSALYAPIAADAQPAGNERMGAVWVPVVIVGSVAFGVVAIAWAVVSYQEAEVMLGQVGVVEQELQGRLEAMRSGKTLQPSTLPELPRPGGWEPPGAPEADLTPLILGAGLLAGAAVLFNNYRS